MSTVEVHLGSQRPGWFSPDDSQSSTDSSLWRVPMRSQFWRPPTDVYETEEGFIVRVEIAGMKANDFNISLENRVLVVRGTRPDQPERRAYHQMEIHFGEFSTEVELAAAVDNEKIEAVYRDGFLRITLPKARPHQVAVQGE